MVIMHVYNALLVPAITDLTCIHYHLLNFENVGILFPCRVNIPNCNSLTKLQNFLKTVPTIGSLLQTLKVSTNNSPARNTGRYCDNRFGILLFLCVRVCCGIHVCIHVCVCVRVCVVAYIHVCIHVCVCVCVCV